MARSIDTGVHFFDGDTGVLEHGVGLQTFHVHPSRTGVEAGRRGSAGDTIGAIGATGRVTGPPLHWSV